MEETAPIPDKTAKTVAKAFKLFILDRHCAPKTIVSDNGGEFNNLILEELCRLYNIHKVNILAHHPSSNGLAERLNRKILDCLRTNVNSQHDEWDQCISDIQCALNSSYHQSLGDTPFFALHGFDKVLPFDVLTQPLRRNVSSSDYVTEKFQLTQRIFHRFYNNLSQATQSFTHQANKSTKVNNFKPGMLVMISSFEARSNSPKLDPRFVGPYRILAHIKGNRFKLRHLGSGEVKEVHGDHIKLLSSLADPQTVPDPPTPSPEPPVPISNPNPQPVAHSSPPVHSYNLRPRP